MDTLLFFMPVGWLQSEHPIWRISANATAGVGSSGIPSKQNLKCINTLPCLYS